MVDDTADNKADDKAPLEETVPGLAVLWLFGPPGVGKSAVGWELYSRLVDRGQSCAFIDIDQLGICYPAPASDPDRHQMKLDNLAAVAAGFARSGVRLLIVAGVLDSRTGPRLDPGVASRTLLYRLRVEPDELRQRLQARGAPSELFDGAVREAAALERTTFADEVLDTTGRSVDQVVGDVMSRLGPERGGTSAGDATDPSPVQPVPGPVLWLWGATGVGKSTIGFRAYLDLLQQGVTAAFVDIEQLAICSTTPDDHGLRVRHVAAVWSRYRSAGAQALVVVGPIASPDVAADWRAALPAVTFCGLGAGREELEQRIVSRRAGGSWVQPGDPLRDRPVDELRLVARRAAIEAESAVGPGSGAWIQTDGMTVSQAAAKVLAAWVDRPGPDR